MVKTEIRLWYFCVKREIAAVKTAAISIFGGDGGIRTLDLTDANRTLSQLSYAPM